MSSLPRLEEFFNDHWQWQVRDRVEQSITLHSLKVELPLSEIYRRINF